MTLADTSKYVLKVWFTTLIVGSLLTFSILSTLTTFASEITNPFGLLASSFMVTLTAVLITAPVALIFYTTTEIIMKHRFPDLIRKGILLITASILTVLFFVLVFGQGVTFLWTYSSTTIFFYSFLSVLIFSILTFKLNTTPNQGQNKYGR